jgi:polysaccharide pyruvyl transferase WcaK-like protein
MRVLIDPGSYTCGNVGDIAMLQVAIERLHTIWPHAAIGVISNAPAVLQIHCPAAEPVPLRGRTIFVGDRFLGRADRYLPRRLSSSLAAAQQTMRRRWPGAMAFGIAAKHALVGRSRPAAPRAFVAAVRGADLVVVSGAGIFTDAFIENAMGVLATLELAHEWNVPTAIVGQGFGPLANAALTQRMAGVLPAVNLIAVRERRASVPLLGSLGVSPDRIVVTGDDAIELANRSAPAKLGDDIGVNVRLAPYAGIDGSALATLKPVLQAASARLAARLLAVPIAHHADVFDRIAIEQLIGEDRRGARAVAGAVPPVQVISLVSRCRLVVTGSYHAAVFALAQGVPAVAIVGSTYYRDKFLGLADLFGGGCDVIDVDAADAPAELDRAIMRAWHQAPEWRPSLLRAADHQIERGKAAYRRLEAVVDAGRTGIRASVAGSGFEQDLPAPEAAAAFRPSTGEARR